MDFRNVSVDDVRVNPAALRNLYEDSEQYQNLIVDVGKRGIQQPLSVREKTEGEGENAVTFFELCDGLHRFSAAKANNHETVPVLVQAFDDATVEETQIVLNLHKVDTKPIDYTKHLQRMLQRNPTMTESELAEMISQSPSFVTGRLGLMKLNDDIKELVNNGDIPLTSAQALSKLPPEEQGQWIESAMTDAPGEFVAAAKERASEIRKAAREGRSAEPVSYKPTAKLRKISEIQAELEKAQDGPAKTTLLWVLQLDTDSITAGQAAWDKKQKEKEERAERRKRENAEKKAVEAEKKAEEAKAKVAELLA